MSMIWSCPHCGTILKLWKVKCPNCHKSTVSWLHFAVFAAVALPALFIAVKMFY